ncbi:MAG: preprotein translocase subunit SecE [bacterium]|nr:preprotein translocase subunit SecE [bacterium]
MMDRIKKFFYEMRIELSRVAWPKRKELWGSTLVVIVISLLLAIFIGFMDILFSHVVGRILK